MAKKLNTLGIVFAALVLVGFILAIVGMYTPIISVPEAGTIGLFDKEWETLEAAADAAKLLGITVPSRTFTLIAFIVLMLGAFLALVNAILNLLGKGKKGLAMAGGALAIIGGILVVASGFVLAGQFNTFVEKTTGVKDAGYGAGIGIWIGAIGGILAGVASVLGARMGEQKAAAAPAAE